VSLTEYMQAFHLPQSIAEPYFNLYADPDGYMRSNVIASYLHLLDNNGKWIFAYLYDFLNIGNSVWSFQNNECGLNTDFSFIDI